MNMRNATCVRTQTSKDPTRVAILFISYSMVMNVPNSKVCLMGEWSIATILVKSCIVKSNALLK